MDSGLALFAAASWLLFGTSGSQPSSLPTKSDAALRTFFGDAAARLPLLFEANRGQTHAKVDFLSRGGGYTAFFTPSEAVFVLNQHTSGAKETDHLATLPTASDAPPAGALVLRLQLLGANPAPAAVGLEELPGVSNYFIGNDPAQWRTGVPSYARVLYRDVYPGIDLVYYGSLLEMEYDFIVAPGADPSAILLRYEGAERLSLDPQGNLVLQIQDRRVTSKAPFLYQQTDGGKRAIPGGYILHDSGQVSFWVGAYDPSRPLVIDPVWTYSTPLGGSGADVGYGIGVDASGNVYVAGETNSTDFPTTSLFQASNAGSSDVFVTKLNAAGSAVVYSTYVGGSGTFDLARGMAIDSSGNVYVTGHTSSNDFPTTTGVFQTTPPSGFDPFVFKLNAAGSALVYSTYAGGNGNETGLAIAVNTGGVAYITGLTFSTNLPTTAGSPITPRLAFGPRGGDAYVTALSADGQSAVCATYLGGTGLDTGLGITVDPSGAVYVTGETQSSNFFTKNSFQATSLGGSEAFVAKLGSACEGIYATYLGGDGTDIGRAIAADSSGNAYVTGETGSTNFLTANALQATRVAGSDAFVAKVNAAGSALTYSTYLGGSGTDVGRGIALDSSGNAYVTGSTMSSDFPAAIPFQGSIAGGQDAFVTKLNAAGSALSYSTYLGDSGFDKAKAIAVDSAGNAYITGETNSTDFPTAGPVQATLGGGSDIFVTKVNPGTPTPTSPPTSTPPPAPTPTPTPILTPTSTPTPFPPLTVVPADQIISVSAPEGGVVQVVHPNAPADVSVPGSGVTMSFPAPVRQESFQVTLAGDPQPCSITPPKGLLVRCVSVNLFDASGTPLEKVQLWFGATLKLALSQAELDQLGGLSGVLNRQRGGHLSFQRLDPTNEDAPWRTLTTALDLAAGTLSVANLTEFSDFALMLAPEAVNATATPTPAAGGEAVPPDTGDTRVVGLAFTLLLMGGLSFLGGLALLMRRRLPA